MQVGGIMSNNFLLNVDAISGVIGLTTYVLDNTASVMVIIVNELFIVCQGEAQVVCINPCA